MVLVPLEIEATAAATRASGLAAAGMLDRETIEAASGVALTQSVRDAAVSAELIPVALFTGVDPAISAVIGGDGRVAAVTHAVGIGAIPAGRAGIGRARRRVGAAP